MPYVLSGAIRVGTPGLWGEGEAYQREEIYRLDSPDGPPVNYERHVLAPHSIPHVDTPLHILSDGSPIDTFFHQEDLQKSFFGSAWVVRLTGRKFEPIAPDSDTLLWRVSRAELEEAFERVIGAAKRLPDKLLLTAEGVPVDRNGISDPRFVLVLTPEAAQWLVSNPQFNLYGTSWKSTDFEPNSRERPIHKILLRQAILFECLRLEGVPEGKYFFSGFPLWLEGASESPVTPVLFSDAELREFCSRP